MMPHLVEMHEKYAARGLVIVTVSVDPPEQKDLVEQAQKFLVKKNVPFRTLLLNEPSEFWNKKLDFTIPPCYYVFDRHSKWVRFRGADFEDGVNHDDLEKAVVRMLTEK